MRAKNREGGNSAATRKPDPTYLPVSCKSPQMNSLRTANAMIALRVFAMLLVVLAHSAMCYTEIKFRTVAWPLHDHTGHCFFDLFCYGVNGMAMPLFFFLAGGSAAYAYRAQGQWKFLWQRLRRLLVPCLTGIVLILPVTYIMMGYELLQSEQVTLTELLKFKFKSPEVESNAFGLVHLWFLEYLFLVSLAYCALRCAGERLPQGSRNFVWQRLMAPTLRSPWKPLLLAIPSCAIFFGSTTLSCPIWFVSFTIAGSSWSGHG